MSFSIIQLKDKENWNQFLLQNNASFLQSFEWGEFQEKLGRRIWRLQITEGPSLRSGQAIEVFLQALVVKKLLPFGKNYFYIPFGPCFKQNLTEEQKKQVLELLLSELQKINKQEKCIYCYIELWRPLGGFVQHNPQKRIQPQQTLVIDLLPSEEQIFKSLKSKTTRYNIRFAQKAGLQFESPAIIGDKEIEIFYNLAQKSAQRDGFANYDKDYFNKLFSVSSQDLQIKLFFAKHQGNFISANILVFFGKTAVHLFGGFDHDFRNLMAPYFMHWNQMLFAKNKMNCEIYDFWGIDEKKWPGVTHFKRSFGGKEIEYPQGYDIVIDKLWYSVFKTARKFLR